MLGFKKFFQVLSEDTIGIKGLKPETQTSSLETFFQITAAKISAGAKRNS